MKRFLISAAVCTLCSCATQGPAGTVADVSLADSGSFVFNAERANPTNYDVLRVMNGIPNSTSTRMLELSRGYTVTVTGNELKADLPYFGRVYNPSLDPEKNGIKFTSHNFGQKKSVNRKGSVVYQFTPNDAAAKTLYLEVYRNGKAFLSVDSNDRQPITYDGYISALPAAN